MLIVLAGVLFFLGSCVPNKRIVYFQEMEENAAPVDSFKYDRSQYRLQKNDIVSIDVKSPRNDEFVKFFTSSGPTGQAAIGAQTGGDLFYVTGYTINDSGYITFPVIGSFKMEGLTTSEASFKLDSTLKTLQSDAQAIVRIGGLRISLLGEFSRPGKLVVMQNQLTIFEAIALGGDLTEVAKRDKVILLRQYPNGAKLHYLNVLDKNIVNSPYYFLQPNDLLYVEPLKRRAYGVGVNGLQTLTTTLSLITTTLLLLNYLR
ncbi:MAG TPA: polysaccharide biosynthesis/export family protein [Bacteroidia bacterium]|nr:polysaccharide biosynthesis/export family protein [Bacteroidia bacterium]